MKSIIEVVQIDIVAGDDGYYVFWPHKTTGAYTSRDLREIADELDLKNKKWDKQVRKYFGRKFK